MKLLFENWRKYKEQSLKEWYEMALDPTITRETFGEPTTEDAKKLTDIARTIGSFWDFTGVLSWPEWVDAKEDFLKNPSFFNSSMFLLATIGVIPIVGGVASAPGKIGKLGKLAKTGDVAKTTKGAPSLSGKVVQVAGHADEINKAKTIVKESLSARALKEAFEAGVITEEKFISWYIKVINPKAGALSREANDAWWDFNKFIGKVETTDEYTLFRALNGQLKQLVEKFGAGVSQNLDKVVGGWVMSLSAVSPDIWNKYLKIINKIDEVPVVAAGFGIGSQTARVGGKNLVRTLMHEIGHIQVLQKLPILARPFVREYLALITKRMDDIARRYNLKDVDIEDAEELYGFWRDRLPAWELKYPNMESQKVWKMMMQEIMPRRREWNPGDKEKLIAALQYVVLRGTKKQMARAGQTGRRAGSQKVEFMMEPMKSSIYGAFEDVKKIAAGLGVKQKTGGFYFLNFEEVGAELFEKAVRKRLASPNTPLASENFPETIKIFQDIIDKEIATMLEENLKPNSSKLIISIKRTIV